MDIFRFDSFSADVKGN